MTDLTPDILDGLNPQQREAASFGDGPLLVVAGAGTGKTATLVRRVAWLINEGVDPARILLLTFTRRASAEMLRRVQSALTPSALTPTEDAETQQPIRIARLWGGTFHAIATRLLRIHGQAIGLPPDFTILDRGDSEDLMNALRAELGLAKTDKRFPKKGTCMKIYSRCVNARQKLSDALDTQFPWCKDDLDGLAELFSAYTERKETSATLDYDDLLLYWNAMLADPATGKALRSRFDCVLVDEYQDTNALQAEIVYGLRPDGTGITVVGDDAQSIYSFRAATIRNILDFPKQYPETTIIRLEQNYRSTQPILETTNRVIAQMPERFAKTLWTDRATGERPRLIACDDDEDQVEYLIRRILTHREEGIDLRRQAVLFRTSHHSMLLEAELVRRKIPFHKYGGLKFVDAAHVKDLMAFLRMAENPRDSVAAMRVLPLLPGIGPKRAMDRLKVFQELGSLQAGLQAWREWNPPPATGETWSEFVEMFSWLLEGDASTPEQVHRVRKFYTPILEERYDTHQSRSRDLEQLEEISSRYKNRGTLLTELALDPPSSTEDFAGPPHLDDDYLILSTIHSAKGLEWDAVYVIHATDGNIPSDMSTGSVEQINEELRLFYVALTRAKRHLYVCAPLRYYHRPTMHSDKHGYGLVTRFVTKDVRATFDAITTDPVYDEDVDAIPDAGSPPPPPTLTSEDVRRNTRKLWE
jgi:DNA helicase II / ATP-dependent DNA helicase PcrA